MKEEKGLLLKEIEDKLVDAQGFVLMRYLGFNAAYSRAFRNSLAGMSSEFEVIKKRLFFKTLSRMGIDFEVADLSGHLGVIFAYKDAVSMLKNVLEFSEKHSDSLVFLGGKVDAQVFSAQELVSMAKLPSLRELKMQLLGVLEAPMSQVIGVIQASLSGVIHCLEEKANKI